MKTDCQANLLTYCQWRGDLQLEQSPFCPVDSLIFCCLSYLNWNGIGEGRDPQEAVSLRQAAALWNSRSPQQQQIRVPTDRELLNAAAESDRFGNVRLFRYTEQFSESLQQQFSATAFLLDAQTVYVAFRGTDDTLTGWREDFNMSFLPHVPSQTAAAEYLQQILNLGFPHVYVGGHSKGGNLAVYAAVHAAPDALSRIRGVYNNDGPGFVDGIWDSPGYRAIQQRVFTFVPQASVVGMLLEHDEAYRVVYSTQKGFLQHDPYSWCVVRNDWYYLQDTTAGSKLLDNSLKQWILGMKPEEREKLTDSLFHVLQSGTNARTVQELTDGGKSTAAAVLRTWSDTAPETKQFLQKMLKKLRQIIRQYAIAQLHSRTPEELYAAMRQEEAFKESEELL